MKQLVSSALALMLFASLLCAWSPIHSGEPAASPGDRTADLRRLQEWVQLEQGLTPENRKRAERGVAEMLASASPRTDAQFFLDVASIVALADNGHSNVSMAPAYGFGLVPLRTYWFSDGLFVVQARDDCQRLLGARIVSIAGLETDALMERLAAYHGGTDEMFKQYFSTPLMLCPALLHAAGLSAEPELVDLEVVRRDGEGESLVLAADRESAGVRRGSPWRTLIPDAGTRAGWQSCLPSSTEMGLAFGEPEASFRYVYLEEQDVVYIQWRTNRDGALRPIKEFVAEVRERLPVDHPKTIVWDNRQNPGGDLGTTGELARELPSYLPENGAIYVLTSNATFSAGIYNAYYPKAVAPDRTVIIGERVGDREVFWAETGTPFRLPDAGFSLGYSLEKHDLAEGCLDPAVCHLQKYPEGWNIGVGSFDPDVEIPTTFADYAANRDPVLEYALELALDD